MKTRVLAQFLLAMAARGVSMARADDLPKQRLDFSVPDVPAFTALGVSPTQVSRPTSVRELAASLATGLDRNGHVQSGLAVEIAPVKLFAAPGDLVDILGGLRLSAGTDSVAAEGSTLTRAALGLRWSVGGYQPEADGDLRCCIVSAIPKPEPPPDELDVNGDPVGPPKKGAPVPATGTLVPVVGIPRCRAAFRAAHLGQSGVELAFAHAVQSVNDSRLSSLGTLSDSVWVTAAWGWNSYRIPEHQKWSDILDKQEWRNAFALEPAAFVRIDVPRDSKVGIRSTDLFVATRLPLFADGWSVFAEGGVKRTNLSNKDGVPPATTKWPAGVGGDVRVGDGAWLGIFMGVADVKTGELLALGNIKWAVGEGRPYSY
jgi:hypothetical protein